MNYETRAIPLLYHKYGDGAVIAKIFTEQLGLKSYSIKRSKSKKSINKISLIDNNCLLFVSGKNNMKRDIQYLNDMDQLGLGKHVCLLVRHINLSLLLCILCGPHLQVRFADTSYILIAHHHPCMYYRHIFYMLQIP